MDNLSWIGSDLQCAIGFAHTTYVGGQRHQRCHHHRGDHPFGKYRPVNLQPEYGARDYRCDICHFKRGGWFCCYRQDVGNV